MLDSIVQSRTGRNVSEVFALWTELEMRLLVLFVVVALVVVHVL